MTEEDLAAVLEPALAHAGNTHAIEDVLAMLEAGDAHLWATDRSAVVALVQDFPKARVLQVWLGGGELREIEETLLPAAEAWGREQGCDRAWIIGRPGWERELKRDGYAPAARLLVKELDA